MRRPNLKVIRSYQKKMLVGIAMQILQLLTLRNREEKNFHWKSKRIPTKNSFQFVHISLRIEKYEFLIAQLVESKAPPFINS